MWSVTRWIESERVGGCYIATRINKRGSSSGRLVDRPLHNQSNSCFSTPTFFAHPLPQHPKVLRLPLAVHLPSILSGQSSLDHTIHRQDSLTATFLTEARKLSELDALRAFSVITSLAAPPPGTWLGATLSLPHTQHQINLQPGLKVKYFHSLTNCAPHPTSYRQTVLTTVFRAHIRFSSSDSSASSLDSITSRGCTAFH